MSPPAHRTSSQPTAGGAGTHHIRGPRHPAAPNASPGVPLRSFPDEDPRTIAGRREDRDAPPSTPRVHEGPGGLKPLDAHGAAIDADPAVPGAAHGWRRPRRAPARRADRPPGGGCCRPCPPAVEPEGHADQRHADHHHHLQGHVSPQCQARAGLCARPRRECRPRHDLGHRQHQLEAWCGVQATATLPAGTWTPWFEATDRNGVYASVTADASVTITAPPTPTPKPTPKPTPDANPQADARAHGQADPAPDPQADARAHRQADPAPDPKPTSADAHGQADPDADRQADTRAHGQADPAPDRQADTRAHGQADPGARPPSRHPRPRPSRPPSPPRGRRRHRGRRPVRPRPLPLARPRPEADQWTGTKPMPSPSDGVPTADPSSPRPAPNPPPPPGPASPSWFPVSAVAARAARRLRRGLRRVGRRAWRRPCQRWRSEPREGPRRTHSGDLVTQLLPIMPWLVAAHDGDGDGVPALREAPP